MDEPKSVSCRLTAFGEVVDMMRDDDRRQDPSRSPNGFTR
jgi:hypothetical protein